MFPERVNRIQFLAPLMRTAQNVGMNKRDAQLLIAYAEAHNFQVLAVRPTRTKLKADTFKKMTGWDKRTNQHARDAAMLVFST